MAAPRLHVTERLEVGAEVAIAADRAHYLLHVLRLKAGDAVRLFNETDGEWQARIAGTGRHAASLAVSTRQRAPAAEPGPVLAFAPIRRNRLEWLVEKATELGAARLVPVLTERTVVRPENAARLQAIAVEAAEQCERLSVPEVEAPRPLAAWLAARPAGHPFLVAAERTEAPSLMVMLRRQPVDELLIGPEGGFTSEEREQLLAKPGARPVSLGPRILRAETAALYALAVWQAASEG